MVTVRERMAAKSAARKFWDSLDRVQRGELGDAMVLGELDWRDWFEIKPRPGFWTEVDYLRVLWESTDS